MAKFIDALSWIAIGMGIALCLYMGFSIRETLKEREEFQKEQFENRKKLMKYHGTNVIFEERGKWYFMRNGEKCKL